MYDTCYYNSVIIWYGDTLVIILTSFYSYFTAFLSSPLLTHSCLAHSHSTSVNFLFTSWSELSDMVSAFEIYRQKDNHKSEQEPRQRRCKHKDRPKTPTSGNTEQNWTQSPLTTNHLTSPQHILMHQREREAATAEFIVSVLRPLHFSKSWWCCWDERRTSKLVVPSTFSTKSTDKSTL